MDNPGKSAMVGRSEWFAKFEETENQVYLKFSLLKLEGIVNTKVCTDRCIVRESQDNLQACLNNYAKVIHQYTS